MKNYKVEAIMKFTDKTENGIKRNVGDVFETTKERYEFLKKNNAVKLIEIVEEPKIEVEKNEIKITADEISLIDNNEKEEIIEKPKKKKTKKK